MTGEGQQLLADVDALDALFASEANWIRGKFGFGFVPDQWYPKTCGCLGGGCIAVTGKYQGRRAVLRKALWETMSARSRAAFESIEGWNDYRNRKFSEIKKLIADTRSRLLLQQEG